MGLPMRPILFAYGTLRGALAPAAVRDVVATFVPLGPATIGGVLYDLGAYPGMVPDVAGGTVHGELFELTGDARRVDAAWRRLDAYEGFDRARPYRNLFRRMTRTAQPAGRPPVPAWVYVYNGPTAAATVVAGGRWPAASARVVR